MYRRATFLAPLAVVAALLVGLTSAPASGAPAESAAAPRAVQAVDNNPLSHGFCNNRRIVTVTSTLTARLPGIGTGGSTHCVMNVGANSAGVTVLQRGMNTTYNGPSPVPNINIAVDGAYGPQTQAAVRRVQTFHQISQDGVYGPQTRNNLRWPLYVGTSLTYSGFFATGSGWPN